jgi:hypothetical protein
MAKSKQLDLLDTLLTKYEPTAAQAFREAMAKWRQHIDVTALLKALSNNDIAGAILAMHLDPAALTSFLDELTAAFKAAGVGTAQSFPVFRDPQTQARFVIGFNVRDPVAEALLRKMAGDLITGITKTQLDAVRLTLETGLAAGQGPAATALDIVGRIGQGGQRTGGVIGLSAVQADYYTAARSELSSLDPALLRNYLTRTLRDKRFDGYVVRALEGEKIPANVQTRMLVSYSNALLKLRGETLARTETLPALHSAQDEAYRQAIQKGGLDPANVTKTWWSAHDERVRPSHRMLSGQRVALNQPFVSPVTGARMMYPGDVSKGAPVSETVNCRCLAYNKIDFLAGVR